MADVELCCMADLSKVCGCVWGRWAFEAVIFLFGVKWGFIWFRILWNKSIILKTAQPISIPLFSWQLMKYQNKTPRNEGLDCLKCAILHIDLSPEFHNQCMTTHGPCTTCLLALLVGFSYLPIICDTSNDQWQFYDLWSVRLAVSPWFLSRITSWANC